MLAEDDVATEEEMKLNMFVTSEDADDVVHPIVIKPTLAADGSIQNGRSGVNRRQSGRIPKKRSLLLPGELSDKVCTTACRTQRHSKQDGGSNSVTVLPNNLLPKKKTLRHGKLQEPLTGRSPPTAELQGDIAGDCSETCSGMTSARVKEVNQEPSLARTKRSGRGRKSYVEQKPPTECENSAKSVDVLLGHLVSAYCGNDNHPENCEECRSRMDIIRALLLSSGKCHQHTGASDEPIADSADSQEPGKQNKTGVGLFCCVQCPDRFITFDELQNHEKMHFARCKRCNICQRYLSARTSMAVVSTCILHNSNNNNDK